MYFFNMKWRPPWKNHQKYLCVLTQKFSSASSHYLVRNPEMVFLLLKHTTPILKPVSWQYKHRCQTPTLVLRPTTRHWKCMKRIRVTNMTVVNPRTWSFFPFILTERDFRCPLEQYPNFTCKETEAKSV